MHLLSFTVSSNHPFDDFYNNYVKRVYIFRCI